MTRAVVEHYLAQLGAGAEPAALAALFAEDVDFDVAGDTATVPWLGRREGRAGVRRFFELLRAGITPEDAAIERIVVDGANAVVLGRFRSRVTATGKLIDSEFAMDMVVRDGLIARYRLFEDSFMVARAVAG